MVEALHKHYMPSDPGMGRQLWGPRPQMAYLRVGCVCWNAGPPLAHCSSIKSRQEHHSLCSIYLPSPLSLSALPLSILLSFIEYH